MSHLGTGGLVEVRIIGLPLVLWALAQEHLDGLLREFTLLTTGSRPGTEQHEPPHLVDILAELQKDYEGISAEQEKQLVDAVDSGADSIDLVYAVPPSAADACRRLAEVLDAADIYCQEGDHLLSVATPPAALAFRRWYLGEFVAQIGGAPALSWPDWHAGGGRSPGGFRA